MYDHQDFLRNPRKYELFKTATVARHVITENAVDDMPAGTPVSIEYRCTARNQLFRRDEPVYRVNGQSDIYANCLQDFGL